MKKIMSISERFMLRQLNDTPLLSRAVAGGAAQEKRLAHRVNYVVHQPAHIGYPARRRVYTTRG